MGREHHQIGEGMRAVVWKFDQRTDGSTKVLIKPEMSAA
jgi:hypothetical protein